MPMDVRGNWDINQGNGYTLHLEVDHQDPDGFFGGRVNIHGKAGYHPIADAKATDTEFTFMMGNGRYTGRFDEWGRLTGITYDEAHPQSQSTWHAGKTFGKLVMA
ncbi:hypothetical protein ACIQUO_29140 [Streptomyces albogriseolus]|uniref:hypothetical protein n=1 Tax=Streptomyces albogriseolus TaxID=1887 RepID=UPI00345FAE83